MASEDTPLFSKPFFFINISVAYVTGLLMNTLLLYLIRKKTPNEMKSYSRIMRIHCISDIIYDFIQVLAGVQAYPIGGKVYLMLQGFLTYTHPRLNQLVIDSYFWSLLFSIALLPIDYIYRYLAVCRNKGLSNRNLFLMVFAAYFITWLHAYPNSLYFSVVGPTPESLEFTRELQTFPYWKNHVPPYAVTVLGSMKSLFNFVFILVLNSFSYGVIIWAYLKINKKLKQNANNAHNIRNSKAIEIQKAVSRILALQALLPLFVIGFPVVIIVILALSGRDFPHFGAYCSMSYIWLSAVKPTATIFIIPRYRAFICHKLRNPSSVTATNITGTVDVIKTTESRLANSRPQSRH